MKIILTIEVELKDGYVADALDYGLSEKTICERFTHEFIFNGRGVADYTIISAEVAQ